MTTITIFHSKSESVLIAVLGAEFKQGSNAVGFNGTTDVGTLNEGVDALVIANDFIKQVQKSGDPEFVFFIQGGILNTDEKDDFEQILQWSDVSSDEDDASEAYVAE